MKGRSEASLSNKLRQQAWNEAMHKGLPLDFLINSIDREIQSTRLIGEFQVYLVFIIFFVFFNLAGRDVSSSFFVGKSTVDKQLGSEYDADTDTSPHGPYFRFYFWDSRNARDLDQFLRNSLNGNTWDSQDPSLPDDPTNITRNYLLGTTELISPVRIRIHRVRENTCTLNKNMFKTPPSTLTQPCFGVYSKANRDTRPFGRVVNSNSDPSYLPFQFRNGTKFNYTECDSQSRIVMGFFATYPCGGYVYDIPALIDNDKSTELINELGTNGWVDQLGMRSMMVEYFGYTPASDDFVHVRTISEVHPGGTLFNSNRVKSFKIWTRNEAGKAAYDVLFLCFVIYYFFKLFVDGFRYWKSQKKKTGEGSIVGYLLDIWVLLEILNLLAFFATFIAKFIWFSQSVLYIDKMPLSKYPDTWEYIAVLFYAQIWFNSINTVIVFLKILKFLRLNNSLNILTRTLEQSQEGLFGVLFIFVLVLVGYAISGSNIYGDGVFEFRSVPNSLSAMGRTLIGDFHYQQLKDENPQITLFFFWSFAILGLFILLNSLIAVLSTAFEEENKKTKNAPLSLVVSRLLQKIKYLFLGGGIQRSLKNMCKGGRSPHVTIFEYLMEFSEQVVDDSHIVRRSDLAGKIIPQTEYDDLGVLYYDKFWETMVFEFGLTQGDQNTTSQLEFYRCVHSAVYETLKTTFPQLDGMATYEDVQMNLEKHRDHFYLPGADPDREDKDKVLSIFRKHNNPKSMLGKVAGRVHYLDSQLEQATQILAVAEWKIDQVLLQVNAEDSTSRSRSSRMRLNSFQ